VIPQNRTDSRYPEPDFPAFHDLARHAIHSSETLDVALHTLLNLSRQHERIGEVIGKKDEERRASWSKVQQHIDFQIQMIRSLGARSRAVEARLKNEINLVGALLSREPEAVTTDPQQTFNLVAQRDSRTMVQVGDAARSDSAAMKTIAILTLVFLPLTYLSVSPPLSHILRFYSHSFFDGGALIISE
jgi:hypothetical protein